MIKIDRSMVSNIDSNENLVKIVRAIVTMSQSLGIKNVFEGIETEAELNTIRNLNGRIIQGYYYSKPLAVDQIEQWLDGTIQSLNTGKKAP
jgi:EAL domain-containing protein (putative c-di-GMP-specific phosphodiesterase class I)